MKLKPEAKAEIILWDWLITKGKYVKNIYFNRINELGGKIFRVEGERKIPDFVVEINDGYGIKYYAVEIKPSNNSKDILKASKILDLYLKNYLNNKTKYYVGEKEIKLNGFLIATNESPKGHLFKTETWIDNTIKDEGLSKYNAAVKYKIIPKKEGSRTFEFIRFLWNEYGKVRNDYETKLDVGILIGNCDEDNSPHIMISSFYRIKNRWTQRYWRI